MCSLLPECHCFGTLSGDREKSPGSFLEIMKHLQVCYKAYDGLMNGANYSSDPSFTTGLKWKPREGPNGTYVKSRGARVKVSVGLQG